MQSKKCAVLIMHSPYNYSVKSKEQVDTLKPLSGIY